MIAFATFDPETLSIMQAALDRAWGSLPTQRRTAGIKERMAEAIMRSAAEGELDQTRLHAIAGPAVKTEMRDVALSI